MHRLRELVKWGWCPFFITALAITGTIFYWNIWIISSVLVAILTAGVILTVRDHRERDLRLYFLRLWHLSGYFTRRFTGNSSLSIFAVISSLFNIDNPQLWDWARSCDISQRIFNSWCDNYISRLESDINIRQFEIALPIYINELWSINNHYYDLIAQFYEIAEKMEVPQETINLYNRFAVEYNAFVQDFRENISRLKVIAETSIEPPSVKFAQELAETGI
ncbi:hypothetical protein ACFLXP_03140 [Chloroflexota bacterium]